MFAWLFGKGEEVALDAAQQKHMRDLHDILVDMNVPGVKVPKTGWFISATDGKSHDVDLEQSQWNPFGGGRK